MSRTRARQLRNNPTKEEYRLWYFLRAKQLQGFKFRRQEKIGNYIVDFVCYEKKLIIELDGGHHALQKAYDTQRTAWLKTQGFRVLRFWNREVMTQIEVVMEMIFKEMN